MSREEHRLLGDLIGARFGISFPPHKRRALEAKLRPRLETLGLPGFQEYYRLLRSSPDLAGGPSAPNALNADTEWVHLAEQVTNNETFFFRETQQFTALFDEGLETLRPATALPGVLRLLCAGCSSGEEPYTLSIFASQSFVRLAGTVVAIDAFDIDPSRVEMARRAEYGPGALRTATPEQLERYFLPLPEGRWALRSSFRSGVRFTRANILDLETFRGSLSYDAVFCRNVLIYFSEEAIRRAVDHFATVLRPGGLLFLGASESIIGLSDCFETVRFTGTLGYRRVGPRSGPRLGARPRARGAR
ncbi:MAG TPA: protein-glutamate O-methyltransferase CheR [Thermoanaerobaculia bacterium]|nr:protein-glutamate O-methyltransferase CheR [Thermoanaerobaculia bacterium]